jgi:hypothetical protein
MLIIQIKSESEIGNVLMEDHSKAYSTAAVQASLAPERPCCRRFCGVEKDASHAGHECNDMWECEKLCV